VSFTHFFKLDIGNALSSSTPSLADAAGHSLSINPTLRPRQDLAPPGLRPCATLHLRTPKQNDLAPPGFRSCATLHLRTSKQNVPDRFLSPSMPPHSRHRIPLRSNSPTHASHSSMPVQTPLRMHRTPVCLFKRPYACIEPLHKPMPTRVNRLASASFGMTEH
jgi:hypothetical protein